ncbi:SIR2 family protein [Candidatus Methanocrinis natronophilus]|uniref:SIR2 family protein n=1 Tax=Candidatus Methanocrinis natronophilus TaxID=3033396 RepID=A0ABT5XA63_9EURY|nr:SIR2 family protein [Candidatus Methanocrinis natronophilus]MDF0591561.1 SIR2 family protein [Candidatus Methanocrinis natronophilus]
MTEDLSSLRDEAFRDPIDQLKQLLSQSSQSFLFGAGCSRCANLPLMEELTDQVLKNETLSRNTKDILEFLVEEFKGPGVSTIEDYMSDLIDRLSIAQRRHDCKVDNCMLKLDKEYSLEDLRRSLEEIKYVIARSIIDKEIEISTHRNFIRAVHGMSRSGKLLNSPAVNYFILNYDTLIEDSLALERVPYVDGFSGGVTGWWDSNWSRNEDIAARVFKVHGSIDWCLLEGDVLPRRIRPGIKSISHDERFMIWPAATKYRETQRDPYAQMISCMRKILRPSINTDAILTICGYGFGDSHINLELDRALRESEQRLTIVAFTNENKPNGQLKKWIEDHDVQDQVRIYANRGFFHGDKQIESNSDLPWWKFETVTRLLGGER